MNTRSFVSVLLLTCVVVVVGSTVDQSSVTTFQPGTPALASEINGNFQALIAAIDDNAARIGNLEQGSSSLTAEDLVAGSTYRLLATPMTVGGSNVHTSGEWVSMGTNEEDFTFNVDGTFASVGSSSVFEPRQNLSGPTPEMVTAAESGFTDSGTWSVAGNELQIVWDDPALPGISGTLSVDGNTLFFLFNEPVDSDSSPEAPADARLFALGVAVKISRAPVVDSVTLVSADGVTATVVVNLSDPGSGGALVYAYNTDGGVAPTAGWQSSSTFVFPFAELSTGRHFWARRGNVPSDAAVFYALPPPVE